MSSCGCPEAQRDFLNEMEKKEENHFFHSSSISYMNDQFSLGLENGIQEVFKISGLDHIFRTNESLEAICTQKSQTSPFLT